MFSKETTTFAIGHFFRTFTFSNKSTRSEKTISIDNKHFDVPRGCINTYDGPKVTEYYDSDDYSEGY